MIWKTKLNEQFRSVKKGNRYILFRLVRQKDQYKYVFELEGKENILKYIKNNGLKPYKEDQ